MLTAIGFTPGGNVEVQYIQSSTHAKQEELHRRINNNEQHTEEHSNTEKYYGIRKLSNGYECEVKVQD